MTYQLEMMVVEQVRDVVLGAGEEVVDTEHIVSLAEQLLAQVRAEKTGAAGDQHAFAMIILHVGNRPSVSD